MTLKVVPGPKPQEKPNQPGGVVVAFIKVLVGFFLFGCAIALLVAPTVLLLRWL